MGVKSLVLGAAIGYVAGARAGVERYEQIKRLGLKVWNSSPVIKGRVKAREAARDGVSAATSTVAEKVTRPFRTNKGLADEELYAEAVAVEIPERG